MIWKAMTKRVQRVIDRRWVMPKIVDHFYAARLAADFLSPRDTKKSLKSVFDLRLRHFIKPRRCSRHRRVAHIELADERDLEHLVNKCESRTIRLESDVANALCAVFYDTCRDHARRS